MAQLRSSVRSAITVKRSLPWRFRRFVENATRTLRSKTEKLLLSLIHTKIKIGVNLPSTPQLPIGSSHPKAMRTRMGQKPPLPPNRLQPSNQRRIRSSKKIKPSFVKSFVSTVKPRSKSHRARLPHSVLNAAHILA